MFPRLSARSRKANRKSENRNRNREMRRRSLFMESLEDRRVLASVAVFDNGAYVDTANNAASESDNVQASLTLLGHAVSTFTAIDAAGIGSALSGKDVLLIPELEMGDLNAVLTPAARTQISNFVSLGGGFVIHGQFGNHDENLLNSVMWQTSSLPASAKSIYATGSNTTVAKIPFGAGNIVFLAYDWFNAAPVGSQDGGWLQVLNSAINEVANTPPTANAGGPYTVAEGSSVLLVGSGSDPDGDPLSYEWDFDYDGSTFNVDATGASVNFSAALLDGPTTQTVALRVSDGRGGAAIDTAIVEVQNVAPQLQNVTVTPSINENGFATLTGDIIDPGTLDTFTLVVDWGDGSAQQTYHLAAGSTSFSVSHQYLDDSPSGTASDTYNVTIVSFIDDDGADALAMNKILFIDDDRGLNGQETWLTLLNELGYDVTYEEIAANGNPTNSLSAFDAVIWSIGDHAYTNLTIQNVTTLTSYLNAGGNLLYAGGHSLYDEPNVGSFAANYLGVSSYQNNMPFVTSNPNAIGVGGNYTLNTWAGGYYSGTMISAFAASASTSLMELLGWNASANDIAAVKNTATFNTATWGFDINQLEVQYREAFLAFTLNALNLPSAISLPITVNNVAPVLDPLVLSSTVIDENGSVTVNGAFTDPGTLDTHEVVIDWGDGDISTIILTGGERTFSASHQYLDDGPSGVPSHVYTITATVTDDDTGIGTASASVTVNNVTPQLANVSVTSWINENEFATLSGDIIDPGTLDTFTLTVDWGDGTVETFHYPAGTTSFSELHQYLDDDPSGTPSDEYTITMTITDDDVAEGAGSPRSVGLLGNNSNIAIESLLVTNGHTVVNNPSSLTGLDTVILLRTSGNANLTSFVIGGGLLITEWTGADWALNTAGLLDAEVSGGGFVGTSTQVTFTPNGLASGLADGVNNPYTDSGRTEFFRNLINIGSSVDILATRPAAAPAIIGGATGNGNTLVLGYDWADSFSTANSSTQQLLLNALDFGRNIVTTSSVNITVNNVAPVITSLSSTSPYCGALHEGQQISISAAFTDVGTLDTHTSTIDWGDGTVTTNGFVTQGAGSGTIDGSHVYTAGGVYTITVTVTDDDGGTHSLTTTAVMSGAGVNGGVLYIIGTDGDDQVTVNRQGNGYFRVHANFLPDNGGRLFSTQGIDLIYVLLCGGDDHATIAGNITTTVFMDGGHGNDHLKGGGGNNILLGGPGNDMLIGGNARDILIGGTGNDRIIGQSGDDILIGGRTIYDSDPDANVLANDAALLDILQVWKSSDSFATRQSNLAGLLSAVTVEDDEEEDVLNGGPGNDWLFAELDDFITG